MTVREYARKLVDLADQLHHTSPEEKETLLKEVFIENLADSSLQRDLRKKSGSFREIRDEAILWQAEETVHPKRSKTAVANVAVVADPPLSILTDKIDRLLKQQEELLGYMSQSAKQSASGYLSTRASVPPCHTNSYISPNVYTDGRPSSKVRCYYCHKLGHVKKNCYKLKAKEQTQQQGNPQSSQRGSRL